MKPSERETASDGEREVVHEASLFIQAIAFFKVRITQALNKFKRNPGNIKRLIPLRPADTARCGSVTLEAAIGCHDRSQRDKPLA